MDKKEFVEKVCTLGIQCIILDDDLINPNEIIVFTRKKKEFLRKMKGWGGMHVVCENGRKRCIRIETYKEAGLVTWEKGLRASGMQLSSTVTMLKEEDSAAVFLYYAYVYVQTENWLYHNIVYVLKTRLGLRCETELKEWLVGYIKKKEYGIKVKNIVKLSQEVLELLHPIQKNILYISQIRLKVIRKLVVKRLWINALLHSIFTQKRYLKYLEKTSAVGNEWNIVKVSGASASVFVKDVRESKTYFIKGNEMVAYPGIRNEIFIQNIVFMYSKDFSWFMPMLASDISKKWVKYEYVMWPILSQYIEDKGLSKEERDLLGKYLVDVLDKLYSMSIVHNDLRGENIMVRMKKDGGIEGFVLIDFGCASYRGSIPWERKTFLGRYLEKNGCGRGRYNEMLVDDAATALLVYLSAGGAPEDENALRIRERIGRSYFFCEINDKRG